MLIVNAICVGVGSWDLQYRKLVRENGGGIQYYFDASKTTHVVTADLADLGDLEAARQAKIHLVTVRSYGWRR